MNTSGARLPIGIVGAGPVGIVAAIGISSLGYQVEIIDSQGSAPIHPHRTIVLNNTTLQMLADLGVDVLSSEHAHAITKVLLQSYQGLFGCTIDWRHLQGIQRSTSFQGLGASIAQRHLHQLLYQRVCAMVAGQKNVCFHTGKVTGLRYPNPLSIQVDIEASQAKSGDKNYTRDYGLLIVADGSLSDTLRLAGVQTHSRQSGIHVHIGTLCFRPSQLCVEQNVQRGTVHENTVHSAIEIFDPKKQITTVVVPIASAQHHMATTIVLAPQHVVPPSMRWFEQRIGGWFWPRTYKHVATYPIIETQAQERIRPRLVALGNAACTLNPLAAQGLNLAYQQCAYLLHVLHARYSSFASTHVSASFDPGDWHILRSFDSKAASQQAKTQTFVRVLHNVSRHPFLLPMALACGHIPFARHMLVHFAGGSK